MKLLQMMKKKSDMKKVVSGILISVSIFLIFSIPALVFDINKVENSRFVIEYKPIDLKTILFNKQYNNQENILLFSDNIYKNIEINYHIAKDYGKFINISIYYTDKYDINNYINNGVENSALLPGLVSVIIEDNINDAFNIINSFCTDNRYTINNIDITYDPNYYNLALHSKIQIDEK